MATYFRNKFKITLPLFLLLSLYLPQITAEEDRDLTGCTVEMDSYFFNLLPLSHTTK